MVVFSTSHPTTCIPQIRIPNFLLRFWTQCVSILRNGKLGCMDRSNHCRDNLLEVENTTCIFCLLTYFLRIAVQNRTLTRKAYHHAQKATSCVTNWGEVGITHLPWSFEIIGSQDHLSPHNTKPRSWDVLPKQGHEVQKCENSSPAHLGTRSHPSHLQQPPYRHLPGRRDVFDCHPHKLKKVFVFAIARHFSMNVLWSNESVVSGSG